jgi:RimJ/RimL family protein N-acetyltransferase
MAALNEGGRSPTEFIEGGRSPTEFIEGGFYLDTPLRSDAPAVVEHLQCREIYENTLRIPWPYTLVDAEEWLAHTGAGNTFAIREPGGRLIGAAGFHELTPAHKSEFGYWLARPYWGQGIMTRIVAALVRHAWDKMGLVRLTAEVFAHNAASMRVLAKNGFAREGLLRKQVLKDGKFIDAVLYALVR